MKYINIKNLTQGVFKNIKFCLAYFLPSGKAYDTVWPTA